MSTITSTHRSIESATPAGHSTPLHRRDPQTATVTTGGVLRSEWVKLRSLRSSLTTLGASALTMSVIGLVFAAVVAGVLSAGDEAGEFAGNPAGATLQGTLLAQLIIGVLGVMVITSEYATGTIRTTLAVVPRRLPVLWAKVAVVTAVTFPTMLLATLFAFLGGQAIIGSSDLATASLSDPGVLRAVVGSAAYLTGIALLGVAIGTLLRSTAAAISTLFAMVFLLPGLGQLLLPANWRDDVLQYLPSNAGSAFTNVLPVDGTLSVIAGAVVFVAWILVPLAAAAVALKRRSA